MAATVAFGVDIDDGAASKGGVGRADDEMVAPAVFGAFWEFLVQWVLVQEGIGHGDDEEVDINHV